MRLSKHSVGEVGGIHFVATHRVLADVARDLMRSLGPSFEAPKPVVIHVGAHVSTPIENCDYPQIGLQTEQYLDAGGNQMWRTLARWRLRDMVKKYDRLLDLSILNKPVYETLSTRNQARVIFGPHIFPHVVPEAAPLGEKLVFVGNVNERRAARLDELGSVVQTTEHGTFGSDLDEGLAAARGVLNLHFVDGVYTEYPRVLKAVLAGQAIWSEPLAPPLVEGVHYFSLSDRPSDDEVNKVRHAMAQLLCSQFSFVEFLKKNVFDIVPKARS